MFKKLFAAALVLAGFAGGAQACNVPNPNLLGPPFVDGCDLPASALNNFKVLTGSFGPLGPISSPVNTSGQIVLGTVDRTITVDSLIGANVNYDAVAGVAHNILNGTLVNYNGVAGYCVNDNNGSLGGRSCVGAYGWALSRAASSNSWGMNGIVTDAAGLTGQGVFGGEFDVNVRSASTVGNGVFVAGASTAQATTLPAFSVGSQSVQSPGTFKWTQGFFTSSACCTKGVQIGLVGLPGVSISSQVLEMDVTDGSGVGKAYTIQGTPASLTFSGNTAVPTFQFGGNLVLTTGAIFTIGVSGGVACSGAPTGSFASVGGIVTHC